MRDLDEVGTMTDILVEYEQGDRFRITVRGHELVVDQPLDDGGGDDGPTPVEVFVAGLASCVAYYAGHYLRRHDIPVEGLAVECDFAFAEDRPARVGRVTLRIIVPEGFPEGRRAGLLAVAEHCTVHNSIRQAPEVAMTVEVQGVPPAGLEPAHPAPEAGALSTELRGLATEV